jgi:HEAT repeat protein
MTRYLLLLLLLPAVAWADGFPEDLYYGGPTLAALLKRLRDSKVDSDLRAAARTILVHAGPESHEAAPQVLMALKNDSPVVRARLTAALARMGPKVVPALTAALFFDDERVRLGAAQALREIGPPARPAGRALDNLVGNPALAPLALQVVCFEARYSTSDTLPDGSPAKFMALNCTETLVKLANRRPTLLDLGSLASELPGRLNGPTPAVRLAARRLALIAGPGAVPALVGCLSHVSARARLEAIEALGLIGHPDAVAPLMGLAEKGTPGARAAACRALGRIGSTRAGPALMSALASAEPDVRVEAAIALGRLGPSAAPAAPALCEALADSEPEVVQAARTALARIGKAALPAVLRLLKRDDELQRGQAIRTLREMAPEAPAVVKALVAARLADKPYIDRDVFEALAVMGPQGVTHLARAASDGDAHAVEQLRRLGPLAAPAVERLAGALGRGEMPVKQAILVALRQIGPAARPASSAMLDLPSSSLRVLALQAMADMGTPPKDAAPLVKKALTSSSADEQAAALNYLAVVGRGDVTDEAVVKLLKADVSVATSAADLLLLEGKEAPVVEGLKKGLVGGANTTRLLHAAWAGPKGKALAPALHRILTAFNPDHRVLAAHALLRIDPKDDEAAKALLALLNSPAGQGADHLFDVVALQTGRAEEFVPALTRLAGPKYDVVTRLRAAQALAAFGEKAAKPADDLLLLLAWIGPYLENLALLAEDQLADGRLPPALPGGLLGSQTRARLKGAFAALDARSTDAMEELRAALPAFRADLEGRVLPALIALGPDAVRAAEASLSNQSTHLTRAAALFLARVGKPAALASAGLKKGLRHHDTLTAARCASALASLGQRASVPTLVRGLCRDEETALESLRGLEALDERGVLPAVVSAMRRLEPRVRAAACRVLAKAGLMAPARAALRDRSPLVRVEAALLLWRADKTFKANLVLAEALSSEDVDAVELALQAVAEHGEAARPLWPAILPHLDSAVPSVRLAAALALNKARGDVAWPGRLLTLLAEDEMLEPALRARAVQGLAQVSGKGARLPLTRLLHGPLPPGAVRSAVSKALE